MVSKKPIKIPKDVVKAEQSTEDLPSINEMPSTGGLINLDTPDTGSPTTGNSGLVTENNSSKLSGKRVATINKTPRQKAVQTNSKQTEQLRISQKRQMITGLSRRLVKYHPIISRVLRFFADKNMLVDPVNQNLEYNITMKNGGADLQLGVLFNLINKYSVVNPGIYQELSKSIKDIKVSPVQSANNNRLSIYVNYKLPSKNNNKK